MSLGEKLKNTLDTLERANVKAIYDAEQADLNRIEKERREIQMRLNGYRDTIVGQIKDGRVPHVRIDNHDIRNWIKMSLVDRASHMDVWYEFAKFFADEALSIRLNDEHDGVGLKDWSVLTVRPTGVKTMR